MDEILPGGEDEYEYDLPISLRTSVWRDIGEITQGESGESALVPIKYPPGFDYCFRLMRVLVGRGELSERGLELSEEAISRNAASYEAWWYRRRCLENLGADVEEEKYCVDQWTRDMPKNYQVWYHRKWVLDKLGIFEGELEFLDEMLREDAKNYNAWQMRLWVLNRVGTWADELPFVDQKIMEDCRNNSAWAHRRAVLERLFEKPLPSDVVEAEISYACGQISFAPHNECPWNYLLGFVRQEGDDPKATERLSAYKLPSVVGDTVEDVLKGHPECRFALEAKAKIAALRQDGPTAIALFRKLQEVDPVRKYYWMIREKALTKKT
uniref:Protein farnesyltransferase/geranylgeranyltransferase type-1 subunit alpha n=1 Tax=Chromera velia CCMP2878 TaxID=1169474 RepID=A0A0G4GFA7_9ALVE|mmetsp:Transcript_27952/g.54780  ORF Transcript_27952/g.54780 Transcript_27952/m.54780 type:complete len:325 (+) Transcript_27952:192-1166(+)|eukprot:Cvel_21651.t1-p1 / transcript=Cvel_21651.t1 / gene=Cvel_21651 / organism=Chromera_velia_CCMP2878 / gene_product=Protein, putative / transcript_product=Protein, putative / location=Cvel_scaffold2048:4738-9669(+) / protein_length=324 / sequence_SO=supercontig / SO=protein_coding / is_pseudo=false